MTRHRRTLRPPAELLQEHLRAAMHELKRLGKQRAAKPKRPQPAAKAPPGLTLLKPDQLKLIRMVVDRSSDQLEQLAKELHIHRRTMSNRLRKIYKLLGVNSRPGLAREAVRWGLV